MNDDTDIYTAFLLKENKEIKIENAKLKYELDNERKILDNCRIELTFTDKQCDKLKKELSEAKAEALIFERALTDACIVIDIYQLSKGKNEELKDIKKRLIEEASK